MTHLKHLETILYTKLKVKVNQLLQAPELRENFQGAPGVWEHSQVIPTLRNTLMRTIKNVCNKKYYFMYIY